MSDNPFSPGHNPFSGDANPYEAPTVASTVDDRGGASDPSLGRAAEMLRQTKPWARFMSVMMFILAAILVLFALIFMAGGMASDVMGPVGTISGFFCLLLAVLCIAPGVFLWIYADRIGVFLRHRSPGTLASALEAQKSFWKFVGITVLVLTCLWCGSVLLNIFGHMAARV